ncbi:MAG: alpha/beta fold hydrolase [Patescibacteria group bacterium]
MKKSLVLELIVTISTALILIYILNKNDKVADDMNEPIKDISQNESYISPISIDYLRSLMIDSPTPLIEEELENGSNYKRYIASYTSEGNKVYGLLTVPMGEMPEGGYPAIVFNHGYIPPLQYQTTSGYVDYVDYLARNGFVVFKIDFRGNGNSEGDASGSYFSSAYTIDAISALKSLQKYENVNPGRIGMWGHSMAGNLLLRAMLVSDEIKVGVIWAGAVYSYEDFAKYRISDSSYIHRPFETKEGDQQRDREVSPEIQKIRSDSGQVDFGNEFWTSISLTKNIRYLSAPVQIHHATEDPVVNIGYSRDLVEILDQNGKVYEFYEYPGGGHNITAPYFEEAMARTLEFFKNNL